MPSPDRPHQVQLRSQKPMSFGKKIDLPAARKIQDLQAPRCVWSTCSNLAPVHVPASCQHMGFAENSDSRSMPHFLLDSRWQAGLALLRRGLFVLLQRCIHNGKVQSDARQAQSILDAWLKNITIIDHD